MFFYLKNGFGSCSIFLSVLILVDKTRNGINNLGNKADNLFGSVVARRNRFDCNIAVVDYNECNGSDGYACTAAAAEELRIGL